MEITSKWSGSSFPKVLEGSNTAIGIGMMFELAMGHPNIHVLKFLNELESLNLVQALSVHVYYVVLEYLATQMLHFGLKTFDWHQLLNSVVFYRFKHNSIQFQRTLGAILGNVTVRKQS